MAVRLRVRVVSAEMLQSCRAAIRVQSDSNAQIILLRWKDPKCPFRTDPRLKLTSVPTLMLWGTPNRLNDAECQSIDNVRMILEDV